MDEVKSSISPDGMAEATTKAEPEPKVEPESESKAEAEEPAEKKQEKPKMFSSESIYSAVLSKIGDVLILHFMTLFLCVPVITIGASVSAASYVGMKLAAGMEGNVASNFMKAFKENFKRSTVYFLLSAAVGLLIYFAFRYWMAIGGMAGSLFICITVMLAIIWIMINLYLFAVQAKFENTFTQTLKNALFMSVRHLHITILMILILFVYAYCVYVFRPLQAITAVAGFGIIYLIFGKCYNMVFQVYM